MAQLKGLPIVIDDKTEVLILGSFPGAESLDKQQYYAFGRNSFWKIMSSLLNEDFLSMQYKKKLETILKHKIGLWDVIESCERKGSLDTAITKETINDFTMLKKTAKNLHLICLNGGKAGKYAKIIEKQGFKTKLLPSTSPTHTISFEKKEKIWRKKILN